MPFLLIKKKRSISNQSKNSRMKEGYYNSGIPCIHTCIHIHYSVGYLILPHHYDYDAIIIHFNYELIIAIVTAVAVAIIATPLSLVLSLSRNTRGAYAFGAIVIFKMRRHAGQINKCAYAIYIYTYTYTIAIVACTTIDDEGDTIMMIKNAIEVTPVYPLVVEDDLFYECEERY